MGAKERRLDTASWRERGGERGRGREKEREREREQDEPSTGLDPASRRTLWSCIREAKKTRAILLTTHSMEEAGASC